MPRARRGIALLLSVLLAAAAGLLFAAPAQADPDPEGGTPKLRQALETASRGFLDAKNKLAASQARQKQLDARLKQVEAELRVRSGTMDQVVQAAYRRGRLAPVAAMLSAGSPEGFLDRVGALESVAAGEEAKLRALLTAKEDVNRARAAVNAEIAQQKRQLAIMATRKKQAEAALAAVSTGAGSGFGGGGSATATPAPRNADGSWPPESCSVNDPTPADGCITPRTLHALQQAKAAGFTHYVSCHRDGGSGEHPKGRACDFAAAKNGFEGVASGAEKTYGTNLANYFIRNSDRLAVLYVIWFKQIWLPSSGWRTYNGGNGDPSSDHTNHVHLSVI
jgi:peptidoglycan DL-endopeptidase CwlO